MECFGGKRSEAFFISSTTGHIAFRENRKFEYSFAKSFSSNGGFEHFLASGGRVLLEIPWGFGVVLVKTSTSADYRSMM